MSGLTFPTTGEQRYAEGYLKGLYAYAHMRDGVYYVGTTGRSLKDAMVSFLVDKGHDREAAVAYIETEWGIRKDGSE